MHDAHAPRVFITNEPYKVTDGVQQSRFNLTPAAKFGALEVLIPAGASLISTVPTVRILRDKLRSFTDDDYLLPVGDPAIMLAAGAIAAEFNGGRIKLLRWDRQQHCYIVIQVDTTGRALC